MSFKNYLKNQNVLVFKNVSFIVSYRVVFMIFLIHLISHEMCVLVLLYWMEAARTGSLPVSGVTLVLFRIL